MRRWIFIWFAVVLAGCSEPQQESGFAGLAGITDNESGVPFLQPGPGERLSFPEDYGPHPQHRIEWWYLTANLKTEDGQPLGLQWTQFRQAIEPRPEDAEPPDANNWPLEAGTTSQRSWPGETLATPEPGRSRSPCGWTTGSLRLNPRMVPGGCRSRRMAGPTI